MCSVGDNGKEFGEVNLTCDAWQADNTDAYFAVTGHWIEEHAPGEWMLEHALLGFAQMNCSHSGSHLGQMLYTIVSRLRIVHKVSFLLHYHQFGLLTYDYIDRSDMSHAITRRTILQCYKNLPNAISSRPGLISMSSADRSGRRSCVLTVGISATFHSLFLLDA